MWLLFVIGGLQDELRRIRQEREELRTAGGPRAAKLEALERHESQVLPLHTHAERDLQQAREKSTAAAALLQTANLLLRRLQQQVAELNARGADLPDVATSRTEAHAIEPGQADLDDMHAVLERSDSLLAETGDDLDRLRATVNEQLDLTGEDTLAQSAEAIRPEPPDNSVTSQDAPDIAQLPPDPEGDTASGRRPARRTVLWWAGGLATGAGAAAGVYPAVRSLWTGSRGSSSAKASDGTPNKGSSSPGVKKWTWTFRTSGRFFVKPTVADNAIYVTDSPDTVRVLPSPASAAYATGQSDSDGLPFYAIGLTDGGLRWKASNEGTLVPPVVVDQTAFTVTTAALIARNATTGVEQWRSSDGIGLPLPGVGGVLYASSAIGFLYALDVRTGHRTWSKHTSSLGGMSGPSLYTDETIFIQDGNDTLYAVNSKDGSTRWNAPTPQHAAPLRLAPGRILLPRNFDSDDLMTVRAVNTVTGKKFWEKPAFGPIHWPCTVAGSRVFLTDSNGTVSVRASADGTLVWKTEVGGMPSIEVDPAIDIDVYAAPVVANGLVYVGTSFGVYALDLTSGRKNWHCLTGGPVIAAPVVTHDTVYAASEDGQLYVMNAHTGALMWTADPTGPLVSSPVLANGWLVVGSVDRHLYGLRLG